ncbi:MAG TPA: DNA translocase FtsK 4TM domain-containing protein, partial [Candidatus Polarisedimenticolia bacterium]|nr:DNA translocase FtsK 4TM domain-containing protein [Candidatus Polarisedimenticolia bacterium]
MSRRRRKSPAKRHEAAAASRGILAEGLAILLMATAVLLALSLVSHRESDPVPWLGQWEGGEPVRNIAGIVGSFLSALLYQTFGWAAWSAPLLMLFLGWRVFWHRPSPFVGTAGSAVVLVAFTAIL